MREDREVGWGSEITPCIFSRHVRGTESSSVISLPCCCVIESKNKLALPLSATRNKYYIIIISYANSFFNNLLISNITLYTNKNNDSFTLTRFFNNGIGNKALYLKSYIDRLLILYHKFHSSEPKRMY